MLGNLPTEQTRSHWAVFLVVLVVILFGLFWLQQKRTIDPGDFAAPVATLPSEPAGTPSPVFDLSALEASAVNIAIPSFESIF